MSLTALGYAAAGGAAVAAGVVNAIAGGGTLISFPALVGLGVPAVTSNVTNTVSLLPGYLAGSWAQRQELAPQIEHARGLASLGGLGGLGGSVLLIVLPAKDFRLAVPYLIVLSCALLLVQDRLRRALQTRSLPDDQAAPCGLGSRPESGGHRALQAVLVFVASVYGGFFGAGLGIMLLAVLGVFRRGPLSGANALKQALSFVINLVAALFFLFSGRVAWAVVPVMAVGSLAGGLLGGKLVPVIPERLLRQVVVLAGAAVAASFWAG
ncbi:MAG TPA: sulfite exporter TauE/SafE family protein [Acidimicrobiales bacterium]|nr:sulfite exporter TauE/SafE family protein [Acidimicrobiales bacterium]